MDFIYLLQFVHLIFLLDLVIFIMELQKQLKKIETFNRFSIKKKLVVKKELIYDEFLLKNYFFDWLEIYTINVC